MKKGATWSSTFGHFGHPRDPHHQTSLPLTATSWHSFSVLMLWGRCPWVSISSEALRGAVGRCRFRGQRFSMEVRNSCVPLQKDSSRSFVRLSLTSAGAGKGGKRKGKIQQSRLGGGSWWLGMGTHKGSAALPGDKERDPQTTAGASESHNWLEVIDLHSTMQNHLTALHLPQITASKSQSTPSSTISLCSSHLENRLLLRSCHDFSWLLLACVKIILSKHYQKNTYCSE